MAVFASPPREKRIAQLAFISPPVGSHIQAVQDIYGIPGSPAMSMRHSVVWSCEDLIASMLSMLQPWAFKIPPMGVATPNPGQGGTGQVDGQPVKVARQPQILNAPASGMDVGDWLYAGTKALFRGNVYGLTVARDTLGYPSQIELQDNNQMQVRQLADGTPEYRLRGQVQDPSAVWHRSIFRPAGSLTGLSILEAARRSVQMGLNAEEFGNGFFEAGAHPSSMLTNEQLGEISQKDAQTVKQKFMAAVHGSREPVVMTGGWKYQQVQVSPTDSQFLDTQSLSDLKVCRYYRVQPELVGVAVSGQAITYANVEQRGLDFLTYTLQRWITWWERKLGSLLPGGQYVKFDLSPILRTDILTRWMVNHAQIASRVMTQDEVRAGEDLPPLTAEQRDQVNAMPLQPMLPKLSQGL